MRPQCVRGHRPSLVPEYFRVCKPQYAATNRRGASSSSSSSSSSPYHQKVTAFPFIISPDEAKHAFKAYIDQSLNSNTWKTIPSIYPELRNELKKENVNGITDWLLPGTWAKATKTFNTKFRWQMEKIGAVYLPTWSVYVNSWLTYDLGAVGLLQSAPSTMLDIPIPGHGFAPLANLWLTESSISAEPEPFTPSMLRTRWGEDVTPVKYTVSPFRVLNLVENFLAKGGEVSDPRIKFRPESKVVSMHAVPILRPVYVSTWILPHTSQRMTFVLPAYITADHSQSQMNRFRRYIYRPVSYGPSETKYVSFFTQEEWLPNLLSGGLREGSSHLAPPMPEVWRALEIARQNRIDWHTIEGVDSQMWQDGRVLQWQAHAVRDLVTTALVWGPIELMIFMYKTEFGSTLTDDQIRRKLLAKKKHVMEILARGRFGMAFPPNMGTEIYGAMKAWLIDLEEEVKRERRGPKK